MPGPSKGILKNGGVPGGDRLRKAKSIETITVRSAGRETQALGPGPTRPLQRDRQPPNSLDLSMPKKPPAADRMKFVEQKLRFSEFLNEITQQVMSPSSLSSLGWKPPEPASAGKAPSTDGSDSKGSTSKSSSPGSSLEMPEGKVKEETASRVRRRPGPAEAKLDSAPHRRGRHHAKTTDEASTSPESGPLVHHLGSLPILSGEVTKGPRKRGGAKAGHGGEAEAQEPIFRKAEKDLESAIGKPSGKEQPGSMAGKSGTCVKKVWRFSLRSFGLRESLSVFSLPCRVDAKQAGKTGRAPKQKNVARFFCLLHYDAQKAHSNGPPRGISPCTVQTTWLGFPLGDFDLWGQEEPRRDLSAGSRSPS